MRAVMVKLHKADQRAEIALCRSQFNQSNGGQKVKHGRHARTPKR